jgi:hypothetical protein
MNMTNKKRDQEKERDSYPAYPMGAGSTFIISGTECIGVVTQASS